MLGVSLVAGWEAAKLPPSRFDPLGPGSFPLALAGILGLLSLAALLLSLRGRDIGRAETSMVLGLDESVGSHRRRPWLATGTLAVLVAYGLVLYAKTIAPLGAVSAVRESSVIFASLIGLVLFHERPWAMRLFSAVIVGCGVIALAAG